MPQILENLPGTCSCHKSGNICHKFGFYGSDILVDNLPNLLLVSKIYTSKIAIFATIMWMFYKGDTNTIYNLGISPKILPFQKHCFHKFGNMSMSFRHILILGPNWNSGWTWMFTNSNLVPWVLLSLYKVPQQALISVNILVRMRLSRTNWDILAYNCFSGNE